MITAERNANRRSGANGKDRHEREYRDQQRANSKARHSRGDLSQTSGNNNQQQEQTSGYKQLPQHTCSQQGNIGHPRQISSPNSQPMGQQQQPAVPMSQCPTTLVSQQQQRAEPLLQHPHNQPHQHQEQQPQGDRPAVQPQHDGLVVDSGSKQPYRI
jgi:hypothetical protein